MVAIPELVEPEFTIKQTDLLPWGGTYEGVQGLQTFFQNLFGSIDSKVEIEEYISAGDHVAAIGRMRGTVRANAVHFDPRIVHLWTVKESRASRFEPYIDTPGMLKALEPV